MSICRLCRAAAAVDISRRTRTRGRGGEETGGQGEQGVPPCDPGVGSFWGFDSLLSDDSLLEAGGCGLNLDDLVNPLDARE